MHQEWHEQQLYSELHEYSFSSPKYNLDKKENVETESETDSPPREIASKLQNMLVITPVKILMNI